MKKTSLLLFIFLGILTASAQKAMAQDAIYTQAYNNPQLQQEAKAWLASGQWRNGFQKASPHATVNAVDFYLQYQKNPEQWKALFDFMAKTDLLNIPKGKHPIPGTQLTVSVEDSQNGPLEKRQSESHYYHIDFQYVVKGVERFGIIDHQTSRPNSKYRPDVMHYDYDKSKAKFYDSNPGEFFIFFPGDWHIAKINNDLGQQDIRVIVIKVDYKETQKAQFDSFKYSGHDARFEAPIDPTRQYRNPILAGFYPDPSVCRVGDTYYMVNSTFTLYPGVPLSTSKDLVNWKPLGHVLDRPSQVPLKNQRVSGGIYAPSISYNKKNKTFYMITTNVGAGNFFVKTKDPAKGWSGPIYLPKVEGIDPSFYFDPSGKAYIVHNAPVVGKADYEGQRAIRLFEFDVKGDSIKGDYKEILRGGTHVDKKPIWIEGPHLFKKDGYYYLICAEGGTGTWHSEVALRAKDPMGKWEECPFNPILTQRTGLSPLRPYPVSSAGHADMVEDKNGQWWAVFLGCRPYEGDMYNTGRDTYLLPVTWRDGWPIILEKNTAIAPVGEKQGLQPQAEPSQFTGNFSYEDTFQEVANGKGLNPRWMYLREPSDFWQIEGGRMTFTPLPGNIYQRQPMSALWVRQQHENFTAETTLHFTPRAERDIAGLALMQKEDYNIVFGKTLVNGQPTLTLSRSEGNTAVIASAPISDAPLHLKIEARGRYYNFLYAEEGGEWQVLARGVDASNLSTNKSGGFIGACIGLYASAMKN